MRSALRGLVMVLWAGWSPACADGDIEEEPASSPPIQARHRTPATPAATRATPPPPPRPVLREAPTPPPDPLAPLSPEQREAFHAGPVDDPLPVEIHYIQSNETRHDLFFPTLEGLGGALVGVGSDQSFTMAAAARSELVLLMDIDRRVADLHQLYAVLVPAAEDPDDLIRAFEKDQSEATQQRLSEAFAARPEPEQRRLLREYRADRETVRRHLQRVRERTVDGEPASWLSDARMFEHVQRLYRAGRVRTMTGDLTGEHSMQTAAAAAQALGAPVRVLYLSNAEEYFLYSDAFVDNVLALPFDDQSVVLRTIHAKTWEHADLWAYQVQPLSDFARRLLEGEASGRKAMFRRAEREGAIDRDLGSRGLTRIGAPADPPRPG